MVDSVRRNKMLISSQWLKGCHHWVEYSIWQSERLVRVCWTTYRPKWSDTNVMDTNLKISLSCKKPSVTFRSSVSQDTMCCMTFQITTAQESTDRTHWCSLLRGSPSEAYTLTLGNEDLSVYSSMNGEEFGDCIGGGWMLVMKINDKQVMQTCWGLQIAIN